MVGTWKDAAAGSCLASACDDAGNSATLINGSTAYVDMCILGSKIFIVATKVFWPEGRVVKFDFAK